MDPEKPNEPPATKSGLIPKVRTKPAPADPHTAPTVPPLSPHASPKAASVPAPAPKAPAPVIVRRSTRRGVKVPPLPPPAPATPSKAGGVTNATPVPFKVTSGGEDSGPPPSVHDVIRPFMPGILEPRGKTPPGAA